jgi:hypothetical protein
MSLVIILISLLLVISFAGTPGEDSQRGQSGRTARMDDSRCKMDVHLAEQEHAHLSALSCRRICLSRPRGRPHAHGGPTSASSWAIFHEHARSSDLSPPCRRTAHDPLSALTYVCHPRRARLRRSAAIVRNGALTLRSADPQSQYESELMSLSPAISHLFNLQQATKRAQSEHF